MNSFKYLLFLFILIPILEIYLFIAVGDVIGGMSTILLIIFTAILGTYLLRIQGISTMQKMQKSLEQGQIPAFALLEGMLILLGGILLLTPGFFTDAIGFACLIPIVRRYVVYWVSQHLQTAPHSPPPENPPRGPTTIEGEYRREDE